MKFRFNNAFVYFLFSLFLFCSCSFTLYAQEDTPFNRFNFDDIDGLKKAKDHLDKGDELREKINERIWNVEVLGDRVDITLSHYLKAQDFNPDNAELNYKIGSLYLYTHEKQKARKFLEKAMKLDPDLEEFIHYYLGWAYQLDSEYDKALEQYEEFEEEGDAELLADEIKQRKKGCEAAKKFEKDPERVWVDNLKGLNSPEDDYSPCITADGTTLYFTSRRKNSHEPDELGQYDAEIYRTTMSDGEWEPAENVGGDLSTKQDETAANLSYDGQKMLLFKANEGQADIYESKLDGLEWSTPEYLSKVINSDDNNETYASYNYNGVKIYYLTDQKGMGAKRGTDIFFSGKMALGTTKFGEGQTGGRNINSQLHEGSVYLHPNGKEIYFSSQGYNSMGGYDIFVSRKKYGQWMEPENLGYPINTPYDDRFFAATANMKYAYIASDRPGGEGKMDLYKVTFWGPEKQVRVDTEDHLLASIAEPIQETHIQEKVEVEEAQSLTVFKGKIIDQISRKPVEASIEIVNNDEGEVMRTMRSNSATGKFLLSLPAGYNYGIAVKAEGYLFHSENFNIPEKSTYNLVNKTVALKNIKVGSKIALRNVFFETGKADIKNESNTELDRLVKLLEDVPSLEIELSGHTDNTGSEKVNKKLSQERAEAVREYLIKEGIDGSRLTAKGYGSSKPVASNETAEGRAKNRRTEFLITAN